VNERSVAFRITAYYYYSSKEKKAPYRSFIRPKLPLNRFNFERYAPPTQRSSLYSLIDLI
jgi:hypothetical protein